MNEVPALTEERNTLRVALMQTCEEHATAIALLANEICELRLLLEARDQEWEAIRAGAALQAGGDAVSLVDTDPARAICAMLAKLDDEDKAAFNWCVVNARKAAVYARELQIAQMAEDTGINELVRFAEILRGEK
jgi:hypothetical protein